MDEAKTPEANPSITTTEQRGLLWLMLTEESQAALQKTCPARYSTKYGDHVTLLFNVARREVEPLLGVTHTLTAYALAHSAEVQAVRVQKEEDDHLPDPFGVPHITLSTAPNVAPFRAVAMLQGEHSEEALRPPLKLQGTIKFLPFEPPAA